MKVSREKAAENRERILDEAARLFRERGLSGVGVDALTGAAGLTHGSLYSQFGSKDCLMAEAVSHVFAHAASRAAGAQSIADVVSRYLSAEHRDYPGRGCIMASLGSDISRQSPAVRQTFTQGVRSIMARLSALLPTRGDRLREDDALALIATMVGAIVLARAVDDPEFSDRILSASRTGLLDDL